MRMMTTEGIKVLDGTAYERDGVGFAGCKGFPGGFGRGSTDRLRGATGQSIRPGRHRRGAET